VYIPASKYDFSASLYNSDDEAEADCIITKNGVGIKNNVENILFKTDELTEVSIKNKSKNDNLEIQLDNKSYNIMMFNMENGKKIKITPDKYEAYMYIIRYIDNEEAINFSIKSPLLSIEGNESTINYNTDFEIIMNLDEHEYKIGDIINIKNDIRDSYGNKLEDIYYHDLENYTQPTVVVTNMSNERCVYENSSCEYLNDCQIRIDNNWEIGESYKVELFFSSDKHNILKGTTQFKIMG
jgi:hypothetical protein